MKASLRLIEKYPFEITTQTNIMQLTYLCFASRQTCDKLKIQFHGYRKLSTSNQQLIAQIIYDPSLDNYNLQQDHFLRQKQLVLYEKKLDLYVSFNVLDKFKHDLTNIINIERVALNSDQHRNPVCHVAEGINIYVNETTNYNQIITKIIKSGEFMIQGNSFKIDLDSLTALVINQKPNEIINHFRSLTQQNFHKKYHNYFEIIIQHKQLKSQSNLIKFVPSKTKLQSIVKSSVISKPFSRTIALDSLYAKIFEHQQYKTFIKQLDHYAFQNEIFCLYAQKSIGIGSLLHQYSQTVLSKQFRKVDCKTFPTKKQFYQTLQSIVHQKQTLVLIKNLDWIQKLSQIEDIIPDSIKLIVCKIQSIFQQRFKNTFKKYSCVIYFNQNQNFQQMPTSMKQLNFNLSKNEKNFVSHFIFDYLKIKVSNQARQVSINMLANSIGWTKIYDFLKSISLHQNQIDVKGIISLIQKTFSMEAAQNVTQVSWDDIGGLQTAKEQIIQTVLLPTQHPEIFDEWIKPRTGLLFYGPPGTGKTLLGKCIAKQCKMGFISVKGPQLLNMYVGESQKNVRSVFDRAKQSKPCIVFMDELDALVPKRGNSSDSNQVMDRIVAQLLTQMDAASQNGIFIIGATNRPDLLDPSILRAGRFDKQIYLGISKNKEDRIKILKAQTRKAVLEQNFDFGEIVDNLPQNFTGADFYGLTSKAMMRAVQKAIQRYEQNGQDPDIIITEEDFLQVSKIVKPSVTQSELMHYQTLKQKFS